MIYPSNNPHLKRVMAIGPSGAGKSTVINALFNISVAFWALFTPAKTSDNMRGCTSRSKAYANEEFELVDSVGLDDCRYGLDEILTMVEDTLTACSGGLHCVFLFVKMGCRVPSETRNKAQFLLELFDRDQLKEHCFLVLTHDEDGEGVEWFERQVEEDDHASFLYDVIGRNSDRIISGTMRSSTNERRESILLEDRQDFLNKLLTKVRACDSRVELKFSPRDRNWVSQLAFTVARLFVPSIEWSEVVGWLKRSKLYAWATQPPQ